MDRAAHLRKDPAWFENALADAGSRSLPVWKSRSLIVEGEATLRGVPILYRGALLPLSDDGVSIDHVLGAANHRTLLIDEPKTKRVVRKRWV